MQKIDTRFNLRGVDGETITVTERTVRGQVGLTFDFDALVARDFDREP